MKLKSIPPTLPFLSLLTMDTSSSPYAFIFACLLCTMMFHAGTCNFNNRCSKKDTQTLLNFKKGVMDPSGVLSSWSTQQDCCEWRGVKCDTINSRVTQLHLPCSTTLPNYIDKWDKSHCLTGTFSLSLLMELEFLNYLDLRNNDFLAIQFDSVHNQNYYNLSVSIRPRQYLNSSTLRHLDLSLNKNLVINSLQFLFRMPSLEYLEISFVDLHMETNWLQIVTTLPSLSELYMRYCQLKDLSPSLQHANFTALKVLYLSGNEFHSELPKWLFNLSCGLSDVFLRSCSLTGQLPKTLLNLRHLEKLLLQNNDLNGSIPDWIGELGHLQYLYLGGNMFSGFIPKSLGNLSSLTYLTVGSNQFTGVVSERNFAKMSKLKNLDIYSSPPLIFDFDSHWIPPFQLENLWLSFSGPHLPAWLYTQRSIQGLSIYGSSFQAPDKFWKFVLRVSKLSLEDNSIDGNLSNILLNSTVVLLSSNGLKGSLPRLSSNVAVVQLSNNSLSGSISPLLCDHKMLNGKSNLLYLDISLNHLSGGLTSCWGKWKSLIHVNLGRNNLTGKIPISMGVLSNLISLHLNENKLYGEIPPSLQNCHILIFDVRENNFTGNIPNWIPHAAKVLQLRSNHFSGNIPAQICQMSSLFILDIADNRISGHIPTCLSNITALVVNNASHREYSTTLHYSFSNRSFYFFRESLELVVKGRVLEYDNNLKFMNLIDMSSNNLSGKIPVQMFSLLGLCSLNLSHNKLTGKIPNEIGNMKNLESLDFSMNQFSGEIPQALSKLSFLSYLNLSFNNLTGSIPSGTQLQGFSELSYTGNSDLCGPPLTKVCFKLSDKDRKPINEDGDESEFFPWFHIGLKSGFVTGFLGVFCAILLNRKWREANVKSLNDLRDRLCVMVVNNINSFC